jgi:formamidopyrimidine-DNA glycosylase
MRSTLPNWSPLRIDGGWTRSKPLDGDDSETMPELPEVETTRRQIAPILVGRRIERVETTSNSYFFLTPPDVLRRTLAGKRVEGLDRAGKYLVARFDCGSRLLLYLGMTGQLFSSDATSVRLLFRDRACFASDRSTV